MKSGENEENYILNYDLAIEKLEDIFTIFKGAVKKKKVNTFIKS